MLLAAQSCFILLRLHERCVLQVRFLNGLRRGIVIEECDVDSSHRVEVLRRVGEVTVIQCLGSLRGSAHAPMVTLVSRVARESTGIPTLPLHE